MVTSPKAPSGKRLLGVGLFLILVAIRLPEVILEDGGWRAWVGSIAAGAGLVIFISDLRSFVRHRRAARQGER
jgi:hypothetical protein